ncbi:uncharacterized protein LOC110986038 [Acanthaster planci]|uniref:Uncharacterized protein LOC110986038 n=1 Tax=Acanthaster planci TaxID=133434 RepID=A0A8B7ZCA6_ACAPL|nr:uncharacterized protein LOC110986038 [Acanthaster planci]XP_022103320.1 uncharacterized protein LOC110986038 [Acanthaster planci]
MLSIHLPGNNATPLFVLLACCLSVACTGAIPLNYKGPDADPQPSKAHGDRPTTRAEVDVDQSRQKTVLVKGERMQEVPAEVSGWVSDNGTVSQQRMVKRSASSGRYCQVEEVVVIQHDGQCIQVGTMSACETSTFLDLGNAHCTTTR